MGVSPFVTSTDGPRVTVAALLKNPTTIPRKMLSTLDNEFLADFVLRKLPPTESGAYVFEESTPLYAVGDAPVVGEFGEIPVISGRVGSRRVAMTIKRALGVRVSIEMKNRNQVDKVNTQITQVRNTFVRTWENAFLDGLMLHPDVPVVTIGTPWDDPASVIREDLIEGTNTIENAVLTTGVTEDFFGFSPNTLIIGRLTRDALMLSDDFNKGYKDSTQGENVEYTGKLPGHFFNVDHIMVSRQMDIRYPGKALYLQRQIVGGIGDERPLSATPMYGEGGGPNGGPTESWRSDVVRQSAVVIDQPKAAVIFDAVLS